MPVPKNIWLVLFEENPLLARLIKDTFKGQVKVHLISNDQRSNDLAAAKGSPNEPLVLMIDRGTLSGNFNYQLGLLRRRFPQGKIIVVDRHRQPSDMCTLLMQGVHGFLHYEELKRNLPASVRLVKAGHLWVPRLVLEEFVAMVSRRKRRYSTDLTPRQKQILELAKQNLSNKEISSRLMISESTVKFHLGNIFSSLGIHDRRLVGSLVSSVPLLPKSSSPSPSSPVSHN
jgi:DNA-binding NarL/FixJ family response regulator